MVVRGALGERKTWKTPGVARGYEVAVVVVEAENPGIEGRGDISPASIEVGFASSSSPASPSPFGRRVGQRKLRAIIFELRRDVPAREIARRHCVSHETVYAIGRAHGIIQGRRQRMKQAREERRLAAFAASPKGRVATAYAAVEEIAIECRQNGSGLVTRKRDGAPVRIYQPTKAWSCGLSGRPYYKANLFPGFVALVATPDGEVFIVEPRPHRSHFYVPAGPDLRDALRQRVPSTRVRV